MNEDNDPMETLKAQPKGLRCGGCGTESERPDVAEAESFEAQPGRSATCDECGANHHLSRLDSAYRQEHGGGRGTRCPDCGNEGPVEMDEAEGAFTRDRQAGMSRCVECGRTDATISLILNYQTERLDDEQRKALEAYQQEGADRAASRQATARSRSQRQQRGY